MEDEEDWVVFAPRGWGRRLGAVLTVSGEGDPRFAAAKSGSASGYSQLEHYKVTHMFIPISERDDKVHSEL
jgi:hypothetical protein